MFKKKFILLGMAISLLGSVGYAQKPSALRMVYDMEIRTNKSEIRELQTNNSDDFTAPLSKDRSVENRNSKRNVLVFYDFEEGMPEGFELIDGDCGWLVGDDASSDYFPVTPHDGNYAYVNDDVCNGNMSDVWMILPPVNLTSLVNPRLVFDSYDTPIDELSIKVSIDNKETWETIYFDVLILDWQTVKINLSDYADEDNVYIAFHYNDLGSWGYGWVVDNISIEDPLENDLYIENFFPYGGITGKTIVPKIIIGNDGLNTVATWTVELTSNTGYSSTKSGVSIENGELITIEMDEWTLPDGAHILTATIIFEDDENLENNTMQRTINVGAYSSNAYAGNVSTSTYNSLDVKTGALTPVGSMSSNPAFPMCETFDGEYIYRLNSDGSFGYVYYNGVFESIGYITGIHGSRYGVAMAYDRINDNWYIVDDNNNAGFYSLDISTLEVTKISEGNLGNMLIAMDFANDGFIYGPSFNHNMYKIDPESGTFTLVGPLGFNINYGQDVSFDFEHLRLYTFAHGSGFFSYGWYDIKTGEFKRIANVSNQQRTPVVILKELQPFYTLNLTVTDEESEPLEGVEVTINSVTHSITSTWTTDENGEIIRDFTVGSYTYEINFFGFEPKSGNFTFSNSDITITEKLIAKNRHNVEFNIKNINENNLNATVYLNYEGNTLHQGTAFNGSVTFYNVIEGEYTYNVMYDSYETISDIVLNINDNITENVTMVEIFGFAPARLAVEVEKSDAMLTWVNYVSATLSYWNPAVSVYSLLVQNPGDAYGVVFDLTEHPYAVITDVDFFHYPYISGLYNYIIHVVDTENKEILYSTETLTTTGDRKWENINLNNVVKGDNVNNIGVFIESKYTYIDPYFGPMTFPWLACDYLNSNEYSYAINLETLEITNISDIVPNNTEYLMNLWILTDDDNKRMVGNKAFNNYEVFLDDVSIGTTANKEFVFNNLYDGTYLAGVRAVYETGTTTTTVIDFEINESNIENVKYLFSYLVNNAGLLTVNADYRNINMEVWSMNGQLVKNSATNTVVLPQKGVYVVKVNIDGKVTNFKVVW